MKSYLDQLYSDKCTESGSRMLMAAIVDRSIRDIAEEECSAYQKVDAATFINTDMCQDICNAIGADHKSIMNMLADLHLRKFTKKYNSIWRVI